jgi:WXXGXW repeat (2 copies)
VWRASSCGAIMARGLDNTPEPCSSSTVQRLIDSVAMRSAAAAASATAAAPARIARRRFTGTSSGGREHGQFFRKFFGPTVRACRAGPVAGADKDFAVPLALVAMKLVNRHRRKDSGRRLNLKLFSGNPPRARCILGCDQAKLAMKKQILHLLILSGIGMFAVNGCVDSRRAWVREPAIAAHPIGEVFVTEPPPVPRREQVGTSPAEEHVWVAGYWTCANSKWVWIPGHWEL